MKNVLIVDDEFEITTSLSEYLTDKGFKVSTCNAAAAAFESYVNNPPDLVLSDIKMPGKSGIDLFKLCASHENSKTPFILMTGYSDIIGVESAFNMGVSELIAKPFDLDTLTLAISYLLNLEGSVGSTNEKYYPVRIDEFIHSKSIDYNIYLKVVDKHILVTKSGQEFTEQRIQNFQKKGAQFIYLNSHDFTNYTDLQFTIASSINKRPYEVARKAKLMNCLITTVSQNFMTKNIDRTVFNNALMSFEAYTQVALNNSQITIIMSHLQLTSPNIMEKSALRAMLSSAVASKWNWNSSKLQSRIILSALMCDVGLKDYPELVNKKRFEYTTQEKITFEQHPFESYKILNQISGIPSEIPMIALQHHENSLGLGFPQKLKKNKLHAYSKIIQTVDEFIEILYTQEGEKDVEKAINLLYSTQCKLLCEQVIKTLYLVFQLNMPKELESLLLPSQGSLN